jgi:hypothetical protein
MHAFRATEKKTLCLLPRQNGKVNGQKRKGNNPNEEEFSALAPAPLK